MSKILNMTEFLKFFTESILYRKLRTIAKVFLASFLMNSALVILSGKNFEMMSQAFAIETFSPEDAIKEIEKTIDLNNFLNKKFQELFKNHIKYIKDQDSIESCLDYQRILLEDTKSLYSKLPDPLQKDKLYEEITYENLIFNYCMSPNRTLPVDHLISNNYNGPYTSDILERKKYDKLSGFEKEFKEHLTQAKIKFSNNPQEGTNPNSEPNHNHPAGTGNQPVHSNQDQAITNQQILIKKWGNYEKHIEDLLNKITPRTEDQKTYQKSLLVFLKKIKSYRKEGYLHDQSNKAYKDLVKSYFDLLLNKSLKDSPTLNSPSIEQTSVATQTEPLTLTGSEEGGSPLATSKDRLEQWLNELVRAEKPLYTPTLSNYGSLSKRSRAASEARGSEARGSEARRSEARRSEARRSEARRSEEGGSEEGGSEAKQIPGAWSPSTTPSPAGSRPSSAASSKDYLNNTGLTAENIAKLQRKLEAEAELQRKLEAELQRKLEAEAELQRKLEAELQRKLEAEAELQRKLEAELQRKLEAEAELQRKLEAELQRKLEAEAELRPSSSPSSNRSGKPQEVPKSRESKISRQKSSVSSSASKGIRPVASSKYNSSLRSEDIKELYQIQQALAKAAATSRPSSSQSRKRLGETSNTLKSLRQRSSRPSSAASSGSGSSSNDDNHSIGSTLSLPPGPLSNETEGTTAGSRPSSAASSFSSQRGSGLLQKELSLPISYSARHTGERGKKPTQMPKTPTSANKGNMTDMSSTENKGSKRLPEVPASPQQLETGKKPALPITKTSAAGYKSIDSKVKRNEKNANYAKSVFYEKFYDKFEDYSERRSDDFKKFYLPLNESAELNARSVYLNKIFNYNVSLLKNKEDDKTIKEFKNKYDHFLDTINEFYKNGCEALDDNSNDIKPNIERKFNTSKLLLGLSNLTRYQEEEITSRRIMNSTQRTIEEAFKAAFPEGNNFLKSDFEVPVNKPESIPSETIDELKNLYERVIQLTSSLDKTRLKDDFYFDLNRNFNKSNSFLDRIRSLQEAFSNPSDIQGSMTEEEHKILFRNLCKLEFLYTKNIQDEASMKEKLYGIVNILLSFNKKQESISKELSENFFKILDEQSITKLIPKTLPLTYSSPTKRLSIF